MAAMRDKRGSVFECVSVHKSVLYFSVISNASLSHARVCTSFSLSYLKEWFTTTFTVHSLIIYSPWSRFRPDFLMFSRTFTAFSSLTKPSYDFRSGIDTLMGLFYCPSLTSAAIKKGNTSLEWVLNKWCPSVLNFKQPEWIINWLFPLHFYFLWLLHFNDVYFCSDIYVGTGDNLTIF